LRQFLGAQKLAQKPTATAVKKTPPPEVENNSKGLSQKAAPSFIEIG
jgi:hypothetical protein